MTYKQIQEEYRRRFNKSIKLCWIADAKRDLLMTRWIAPNRIDSYSAKYPCPNHEIKERIKKIILANY
jgi:hypothetical protein